MVSIRSKVPRIGLKKRDSAGSSGGRAGSQSGSQSRTRAGSQRRSSAVKRTLPMGNQSSMRFGTQERGSQTDGVARTRRNSPQPQEPNITVQGGGGTRFIGDDVQMPVLKSDVPTPQNPNVPGMTPGSEPGFGRDFSGGHQAPDLGQEQGLSRVSPPQQGQQRGGQPVTDPNQLDRFITPENTLRQQRLGFGVEPQSLADQVQQRFESALPQLNANFQNQAEDIAQRTSRLGRTGSGMVDREFADLENEQRAARENLLGRLTFQGAQSDVGRDMQAQMAQQQHLRQQQQREDQLARQGMSDRAQQMRFLQMGMQQPTSALQGAAQTQMLAGNEFGANAAGIGQGLGGAARGAAGQKGGIGGIINSIFGGPQSQGTLPVGGSMGLPNENNRPQLPAPDTVPNQPQQFDLL